MIMKDLKSIGGARKLFNYLDEDGKPRPVKPKDIDDYLKTVTAPQFSAKDFRTWGGTILAALELADLRKAEEETTLKKNILNAVKKVATSWQYADGVPQFVYYPTVLKSRNQAHADKFSEGKKPQG